MTHPLAHLNPDCMVVEDLAPLAQNLRRLAHYCDNRGAAMQLRRIGKIQDALVYERHCETLYAKLPTEWEVVMRHLIYWALAFGGPPLAWWFTNLWPYQRQDQHDAQAVPGVSSDHPTVAAQAGTDA